MSEGGEGGEYHVRAGDTLWSIAASQLGDPYRWPEIAAVSASITQPGGVHLIDPDLIRPGWTLALPGAPPPAQVPLGVRVTVAGVVGATAVTAGENHSCALIAGGLIKCWGDNDVGKLGDGTTESRATPVTVAKVSDATTLMAVSFHTCAVVGGGMVVCWGRNTLGSSATAPLRGARRPSSCPELREPPRLLWGRTIRAR